MPAKGLKTLQTAAETKLLQNIFRGTYIIFCFCSEYAKHIRLGELILDSNQDDAMPEDIPIKNITVHPNYSATSKHNDIALFELERAAILNSYVRPACLNTNRNLTINAAVASGWGRTDYASENTSKDLLKVTLDMFTYQDCKRTFDNIDDNVQVCAGSRAEQKDTCQVFIFQYIMCTSHVPCAMYIGLTYFAIVTSPSPFRRRKFNI